MRTYKNIDYGTPVGTVYLTGIKLRNHHGKKSPVALYRHQCSRSPKLRESKIVFENDTAFFVTGTEGTRQYIPNYLLNRMRKVVGM